LGNFDRRTTEMNELRSEIKRLREALQGLMDIYISGERYGSPAKEAWDFAVEILNNSPNSL